MAGSIIAGSLRDSAISKPIMDLVYEGVIYRNTDTYTQTGSLVIHYDALPGAVPCDVSPVKDPDYFAQPGQTNLITHIIHFPAGTVVNNRDAVKVVNSKTGFGPIGQVFYLMEVLLPSETISFVRCRAVLGKEPTTGA